jgi:hypothetical protein
MNEKLKAFENFGKDIKKKEKDFFSWIYELLFTFVPWLTKI